MSDATYTFTKDVAGKTVECAYKGMEAFTVFFTDRTFVSVEAERGFEDCIDLEYRDSVSAWELHTAGLIDEDEYEKLQARAQALANAEHEKRQRELYLRLKKHYGDQA